MASNCPTFSAKGAYTYSIQYPGPVDDGNERIRFLLDYRNASKYDCMECRTGLYVDSNPAVSHVEYIEWDTALRPPMAEPASEYTSWTDESFNTEIVVYLNENAGNAEVSLSAYVDNVSIPITVPSSINRDDCTVSGESYIPVGLPPTHRLNVISEHLGSRADIVSLTYRSGVVTVITSAPHGFSDGDAITVSGVEHCAHAQGVNGERYNGIYFVTECTETSFKYTTLFDGLDYAPTRTYLPGDGVFASKWVVNSWEESVTRAGDTEPGKVGIIWPYESNSNNRMIIGDKYTIVASVDGVETKIPAKVTNVDGDEVELSFNGPVISDTNLSLVCAPRVPSSDVPANYPDDVTPNIPAYSHASTTSFISVYDDTSVSDEFDGTINVASPLLQLDTSDYIVFKFNPGYRTTGANTVEVTCHIADNTYPEAKLALYELRSAAWDMSIDSEYIEKNIIYDVLDTATIINPGITGGTAVRFIVTGTTVERWYATGKPVSLAIRVIDTNYIDHMSICSTESEFPITVVGGAGKQATMNPVLFNVLVKPPIPNAGDEISIYTQGSGSFTSIPGGDVVMLDDMECDVVSSSSSMLIAKVPVDAGGVHELIVYRDSNGELIPASNPVQVIVNSDIVRDVVLGNKIRTGVQDRIVSRSARFSKDLSFNGFTEVTDANNLIQNIYNILLTNKGERLFNIGFGADIESKLFSLYAAGNLNGIIMECARAIGAYEKRVTVNVDHSYVDTSNGNYLFVNLAVDVPGSREQIITLPFSARGKVV